MGLIGRREERARLDRLLGDARRGTSGTIVLRGEPGIGKSALLGYAVERADEMETLRVVGVESEADLPFAALHALLRAKIDLLDLVPAPQARALRAALALGPAEEGDRLAAYAGTLSLLSEAAEQRPLLVAVDDAHWLDRASAEALVFAARRSAREEIAFVFAVRDDDGGRFDSAGLPELLVGGLDEESALELLRARSVTLDPAVARMLVEETTGNPLALVELPAVLSEPQITGRMPIERPLPIGTRIGRAFLVQIGRLPPATQRALVVAAAGEGAGMTAVADAAAALGCGPDALTPAEAAGLVHLTAGALSFRHPLVRSAVYHAAAPAERRAAHAALAAALDDGDRRAWQLAAAAEDVDEEAAAALEQAAERAGARGSHAAQWRALERAVELSSAADERTRRMLRAARAAFEAGEHERARELVEEALPLAADPLVRADLLHQQAVVARWQGLPFSEEIVVEEARSVRALDAERAAKLLGVILEQRLSALDTATAVELAAERAEMCAAASDEWRLRTLGDLLRAHTVHGNTRSALALLPALLADSERAAEQAPALIWLECYDDARRVLAAGLERARTQGHPVAIGWAQACAAMLALATGRTELALAAAAESAQLAEQVGADDLLALNLPTLARIAALQGRGEDCREHAALAKRLAAKLSDERVGAGAELALGLLALGIGTPEEAIAELEPVARLAERKQVGEPSVLPFEPDLIEAYTRHGDLAAARGLLDTFTGRARAAQRAWALAAAARCTALLAGDDEVDARFRAALELGEQAASPFERARTELCYGERLRRANRRKDARAHLSAAVEIFDEAGAAPWAERARAELRATGAIVKRRDPSAPERLTPQELQIALLVADGKSNREVAGTMFVSRKTVEYHLSHIYRKLNIHSRAELTSLFAANLLAPAAVLPRAD